MKATSSCYFKLSFADSLTNPIICQQFEFLGFDHYRLFDGYSINDWPSGVTFYYSQGDVTEDFLGNSLGLPIVSARIRGFLELVAGNECQMLPVSIIDSRTGKVLEGYSVLNLLNVIPALDRVNAKYQEDPKHPDRPVIFKVVLYKPALKATRIFRLSEQKTLIFVSEEMRKEFDVMAVTGVLFSKVMTLGD